MKVTKFIPMNIEITFPYYTQNYVTGSMYAIISENKTVKLTSTSIESFNCCVGAEHDEIRESYYMDEFNKLMEKILGDIQK